MMVPVHVVDEYYDCDEKDEPTKEGQKTTTTTWSFSYISQLAGKQDNKMEYMEQSCMSNINLCDRNWMWMHLGWQGGTRDKPHLQNHP